MAEFRDWRRRNATLLAARAERDAAHATTKPDLTLAGTCGVCLRPATFRASTARSEPTATGRVPAWREQLHCDCDSALPAHHRAILQFVRGTTGLQPWFKIRVHGAQNLAATLAALAWVDPNHAHPHLIVAPDSLPDLTKPPTPLCQAAISSSPARSTPTCPPAGIPSNTSAPPASKPPPPTCTGPRSSPTLALLISSVLVGSKEGQGLCRWTPPGSGNPGPVGLRGVGEGPTVPVVTVHDGPSPTPLKQWGLGSPDPSGSRAEPWPFLPTAHT